MKIIKTKKYVQEHDPYRVNFSLEEEKAKK